MEELHQPVDQPPEWDMIAVIRAGNGYLDEDTFTAHVDELFGATMGDDAPISSISILRAGGAICQLSERYN